MEVLIVGSGLTGLWIAQRLKQEIHKSSETSDFKIRMVEKSRGVGGRMATRRTDQAKFDHGAQFYTLKPESELVHRKWLAASLVTKWFENDGIARMKASGGMTSLAKYLAQGVEIEFETKIDRIESSNGKWRATSDSQKHFEADILILTAPVPQALELLTKNHLKFEAELSTIQYAKALVGLFEGVENSTLLDGTSGYRENIDADIFSIADQRAKGLTQTAAWTVTMSPAFSERFFDADEEASLKAIAASLRRLDPGFKYSVQQLKKWRFSHPLGHSPTPSSKPFAEVQPGLFLAGDGFARPSLNGALSSANALADSLLARAKKEMTPA